ncbi:putative E3 ubiquitin-protein ligase RLIM [Iris pallida]|uniref:E3 ubiquitin-protein ligase RLIM n=1 Tax=Iris pallida TaxID=29817 RepID=A0AAX6IJM0_IRIPA|nr:putative E3 ubiquitin-protein ligase RLIM [Iris pallida]
MSTSEKKKKKKLGFRCPFIGSDSGRAAMGSGSSKGAATATAAAAAPSSSAGGGRRRSTGARILNAACFGIVPSALCHDEAQREDETRRTNDKTGSDRLESTSTRTNNEGRRKHSHHRHAKIRSLTRSNAEHGQCDQDSMSQPESGAISSSAIVVGQSSNHSGRSHSRFNFIPDSIGFRLGRTISLGSSRGCSFFSDSISSPNNEGGCIVGNDNSADNQGETPETVNVGSSTSFIDNASQESNIDSYSHRNHTGLDNADVRRSNRRLGPQEALEGSVRFSRTLSVGRLRDRVLRRTSSNSAGLYDSSILDDTAIAYSGQSNERRAVGARRRVPSSDRNNEIWQDFSTTHPYRIGSLSEDSYDNDLENPHWRNGSNHDSLEHRSAFFERRRRIRSQVRALQRLGSRFENLSGHERSCISSGQHRSGRCTCRTSNRAINPNDDTGTRASISRIVMLAEALFEVLDEIHQQSVALSSRPSFSSIGSVPAPKEVVECIPLKVYVKPQKHQNEEAAQCYICLVEYENGDFVRILPCNHEFHQTCIDKWLKEIHRVCPLCRGDVCRADASGSQKIS